MKQLAWQDIWRLAERVAESWKGQGIERVYGIPQGGLPVAIEVAKCLHVPVVPWAGQSPEDIAHAPERTLVVDDLVDSGRTMVAYFEAGCDCDALLRKPHSPNFLCSKAELVDEWVVFPWERRKGHGAEDAVVRLLQYIGEDPSREGLIDTPRRVCKALREMTEGMRIDPAEYCTTFEEQTEDPVVVKGIRFSSLCEHHLLPFSGTAVVAYVPRGRVLGLSKLPRVVEAFARRPQMQERLTRQIAEMIRSATATDTWRGAAACVIKAHHSCMGCRGVRQMDAEMITSHVSGTLPCDPDTFLSELRGLL